MKLIVGLGNPGDYYSGTRHNVGFMVMSALAKQIGTSFTKKENNSRTAHGTINGTSVILARPQTYMNNSGESVKALMHKYKIEKQDLIVVHDDMDLPLAKLRIRNGGSSGGHKGINSIIARIGSPDFARIKIGIGHPAHEANEVIDYVLEKFSADEKKLLDETIDKTCKAIIDIVDNGIDHAMNEFNSNDNKTKQKNEKDKEEADHSI